MDSSLPLGVRLSRQTWPLARLVVFYAFTAGMIMTIALTLSIQSEMLRMHDVQARENAEMIARYVQSTVETSSNQRALRRHVAALGTGKNVESILVAGGEPLRVLAATDGQWLDRTVEDLPNSTQRDMLLDTLRNNKETRTHDSDTQRFDVAMPLAFSQVELASARSVQGAIVVGFHVGFIPLEVERRNASLRLIAAAAVVLLMMLGGGVFVFRRILRPLRMLRETIERRRNGDLAARTPILAGDEIGQLAATTNEMFDTMDAQAVEVFESAESLQRVNADLEARVEIRTNESKRQAKAMDTTADGMAIVENGCYIYLNPAFPALFGYDFSELMGRDWRKMYSESESERLFQEMHDSLQNGGEWSGEVVTCRKDGTSIDLAVSLNRMSTGESIVACRDISLLKQRAREIEELYNSAPCGYQSLDADGNIIRINDTELRWFGVTRQEALGKPFLSFVDERHHEALRARVRTIDGREEIAWTECEIIHSDGSRVPVLMSATAKRNESGELMQVHCTIVDIIERKRAEEEVMHAVRLNNEFLANMSHELRTPLNAILGLGEVLRDGLLGAINEKQSAALSTIYSSGNHLLGLINDVIDYSKIEAGRLEIVTSLVSVDEVCRESLDVIRDAAESRNLDIIFDAQIGALTVQAEYRRLNQCLVNLLSNAVKFTPGGGRVGLEVKNNPGERWLMFAVWDTGIGISQADQAHLFQSFFQVSTGSTRTYDGAGLGLSLTKRLVELHGGTLRVQSTPGKGSRFELILPWEESKSEHPSVPEDSRRRSSIPLLMHPAAQPLVLIVDDDEWSLHSVGKYLELKGYSVAFTKHNDGVIELVKERMPALIFMDVSVSDIYGIDVIRRLRDDPDVRHVSIIALGNMTLSGERERSIEAGAEECLAKPIVKKELGILLRRLTEGMGAHG